MWHVAQVVREHHHVAHCGSCPRVSTQDSFGLVGVRADNNSGAPGVDLSGQVNGRRAAQLHAADDANALIGHGNDALHKIGDLRAARCWFEQAYLAAERASDVDGMATAALGIGGLWVHEHRDAAAWAQAISWQRRSLAAADASTELAARLRARVAAEEDYRVGRHREVLRALEEARSRDNPRTLAMTLSLAHHACWARSTAACGKR